LQKIDNGALDILEAKTQELEAVVAKKEQQIKSLTDQLAWFRHKFFGTSSEKHISEDPDQRKIDWEGLEVLPEEKEAIEDAEKELIEYERRKPVKDKKKAVRQPLPDHLRREVEVIEPEGKQDNWVRIGVEVTEILEHKPGETYVRRIERPKYTVKPTEIEANVDNEEKEEETPAIRIASMPLLPLPRSNAGPSMLAELIMNKYFYHLPFHRQISMLKMEGIRLPASTINGWFQGSSDLLRALYARLKEIVLKSNYIQVDESTIPVINNEKHKAQKAYLWMVRSVMDNMVFFHYDKGSRAQKVVVDLLKNYQGLFKPMDIRHTQSMSKRKVFCCWVVGHMRAGNSPKV